MQNFNEQYEHAARKYLSLLDREREVLPPDTRTLDFLKHDLGLNVVVSNNLFDLPFETQTYEAIISSGFLEHVNEYGGNIDTSLRELLRICLPGGKVYIWRLPFAWSVWEYFRYVQGRWEHPDRYTVQQLQNLEIKFPFKLVEYELDGFLFFRLRAMLMRTCVMADLFNKFEKLLNLRFFHVLLNDIFVVFEKIDETETETD